MKQKNHNEKNYLHEIDGLRAIAVLSVLLFHFHVPFFDGGYIGVDVFFVISGYLITGIITQQLSSQTFSFVQFYLRRIRRLFPALLAVITFCYLTSFVLLSPNDFERFSGATVTSIISLSNFFFFFESGYFDADSYLKPLLHTWSLAVEEQFYLIWPLLLFLFRKKPLFIIVLISITSLVFSLISIEKYPSANFYLMPFRIFEFGLGAITYWLPQLNKSNKSIEPLAIAGMALIIYSIIVFDEATAFPSVNALYPCIGALLLINSRNSQTIGCLLRSRVATHLGKISYSLYLVHWPIVVFYKYITVSTTNHFSVLEILLLILTTYALALLLNKYIEKKFRYQSDIKKKNMVFWIVLVSLSLIMIILASSSWLNKGWPWRANHDIQNIVSSIPKLRKDRLHKIDVLNSKPLNKNQKNIVILGDSHANDLLISFASNSNDNYIRIPIHYHCQPVLQDRLIEKGHHRLVVTSEEANKKCTKIIKSKLKNKHLKNADVLLITARWKSWAVEKLPEFIDYIKQHTNAKIVVFGPTIEFKRPLPFLISKHNQRYGLEKFVYEYEDKSKREIAHNLEKIARSIDIAYVDKYKVLCGSLTNDCPIILPDGGILAWDYGHWTIEAAQYFKNNLQKNYPEIAELLF